MYKYLFLLLSIIIVASCTTSPDSPKASLTGNVSLSNSNDHSGVTVALYNLAKLDTTIVRINNEYPHIGVIISQETEFDHRLQKPVAYTQTDINGNFKLKDVRPGTYNVAFLKEGWSLKYIYNVSLSEGDNVLSDPSSKTMYNAQCHPERSEGSPLQLLASKSNSQLKTPLESQANSQFTIHNSPLNTLPTSDYNSKFKIQNSITLLPSVTLPPVITSPITFESGVQYNFPENTMIMSSATLEPGAILAIDKDKKVEFYSDFSTSPIGDRWKITTSVSLNSIFNSKFKIQNSKLINNPSSVVSVFSVVNNSYSSSSMQLDSTSYFGRVSFPQSNQGDVTIQNGLVSQCKDGINIYPPNSIYNNIRAKYGFTHANIYSSNHLFTNNLITNFTQRVHAFYGSCTIEKNIFYNNIENMLLSENQATVQSNYFHSNYVATRPFYGNIHITHNNFHHNSFCISTVASTPLIDYNNFYGSKVYCIQTHYYYIQGYCEYSNPIITYNNLYSNNIAISLIAKASTISSFTYPSGRGINSNIDAKNNFWKNTPIEDHIIDNTTYPNEPNTSPNYCPYSLLISPIIQFKITNSGII